MTIKQFHMKLLWAIIHPELFLLPYGKKKPEEKYAIRFYIRTGSAELTENGDYIFTNQYATNLTSNIIITNEDETRVWRPSSTSYYKTVQLPVGKFKVKIIRGYNSSAGFYLDNQWFHFEVEKVNGYIQVKTNDYGYFFTASGTTISMYTPVLMKTTHVYPSDEAPAVYTCHTSGVTRPNFGVYNSDVGHYIPSDLVPVLEETNVSPNGSIKMSLEYILLKYGGNEHINFGDHLFYEGYCAVFNSSANVGKGVKPGGTIRYESAQLTYLSSNPIDCNITYNVKGALTFFDRSYFYDPFGSKAANDSNAAYTAQGSAKLKWAGHRGSQDDRINTIVVGGINVLGANAYYESGANAYYESDYTSGSDLNYSGEAIVESFSNSYEGYKGYKITVGSIGMTFPDNVIDEDAKWGISDAAVSAINHQQAGSNIKTDKWWAAYFRLSNPLYYGKYYNGNYLTYCIPLDDIYSKIIMSGLYDHYPAIDKNKPSTYWAQLYRGLYKTTVNYKSVETSDSYSQAGKGTVYSNITSSMLGELSNMSITSGDRTWQEILSTYINEDSGVSEASVVDISPKDYNADIIINYYDVIKKYFFEDIIPASIASGSGKLPRMLIKNGNSYVTVSELFEPISANNFWWYSGAQTPKTHTTPDYDYWMSVPAETA